ncbi:secondary thiamine-phosphate synthase enzyme YjbQ [Desulfococcaceae bacterium HSG9]|nr:secondary thiamine-phosphate synthase enzyme YjbQ [Desulfococcaceae bacterium HSG9]
MIITLKTHAQTELIDITAQVEQAIRSQKEFENGFCFIFTPHTTAAITINESADPSVKTDILSVLNKVIPWNDNYRHLEGNSAAHIKSILVGASEQVAVEQGRLVLGTWQGLFFCEFDGPRTRKVHVKCFS